MHEQEVKWTYNCIQVTTHSHLLTGDEVDKLMYGKPWQISTFLLQEFDTELDFSNKVG